jgi:hypothetical protein
MALFESAVKMFTPFYQQPGSAGAETAGSAAAPGGKAEGKAYAEPSIDELQARLNAMQSQIDALTKNKK